MTGADKLKLRGRIVPLWFFGDGREETQRPVAWTLAVLCCVYLIGIAGCATSLPRDAVPVDQKTSAKVAGIPKARAMRGEINAALQAEFVQTVREDPPENYRRNPDGSRAYDILSISGGGSNGAFGAGVLNGWSNTGTRPSFKIVTGISTGALSAPFAFLGPAYDATLKEVYTSVTGARDIYREKGKLAIAFGGESLADNKPFARRIEKHVDEDLLKAVGREHQRGRRLLVGTTDLDAEELVVWDMGLIAASGHPKALDLFRKVLLASASIPVLMPPVLIEVEVDGKRYDEMHVDGNTTNSAFFHGGIINIVAIREELAKEGIRAGGGQLYVIQNGRLGAEAEEVERTLKNIIGRSVSTMLRSNRRGDLYRMYLRTQRYKLGFNFVAIPDDYEPVSKEPFNQEEMNRVFELGVRLGSSGTAWSEVPPGAGLRR